MPAAAKRPTSRRWPDIIHNPGDPSNIWGYPDTAAGTAHSGAMKLTENIDDLPPVNTLEQARARVFDLVGHALRRQLWLMLLDPHGNQLSLLVPLDGIPLRPEPGSVRRFAVAINAFLAHEAPGGSIIVTLERPGSAALTAPDQAWAVELAQSFGKLMPITGLFVAHDDGVAVLRP